ncbi:hypothetical protein M3Y99_00235400 [Aphelenchoides fujianensis]|nr:hypothetical protein M3Y99_00235400 [Aphelenchoides fujianensis]
MNQQQEAAQIGVEKKRTRKEVAMANLAAAHARRNAGNDSIEATDSSSLSAVQPPLSVQSLATPDVEMAAVSIATPPTARLPPISSVRDALLAERARVDDERRALDANRQALADERLLFVEEQRALAERIDALVERARGLDEKERELAEERRALDEERRQFDAEREPASVRIDALAKRNADLQHSLGVALRGPRKAIDECGPRQQKRRLAELQEAAGDSFELVPANTTPVLDTADCRSIRAIAHLTDRKYAFLSPLSGRQWATLRQVRSAEERLIDDLGGIITQTNEDGIRFAWMADPALVLRQHVEHLKTTEWGGQLPGAIKIVVAGDCGGNITKFGVFIPTAVAKPQTPSAFVLMALWEGGEGRENITYGCAALFTALDNVTRAGGLEVDGRLLSAEVLLVGDLKLVPEVLGEGHFNTTNFCPWCLATKSQHNEAPTRGADRTYDAPLLLISPENVVPPSLHILQGLVNKVLHETNTQFPTLCSYNLDQARVPKSHQTKSLCTGRGAQKFLEWVEGHEDAAVMFRNTLLSLKHVSTWAAVDPQVPVDDDGLDSQAQLEEAIDYFSADWRYAELSAINKLHILEQHVHEFYRRHGSWGCFSEQSLESMHHVGNMAVARCVGANKDEPESPLTVLNLD